MGIREYQEHLAKDLHAGGFKADSTIQIQDKPSKPLKHTSGSNLPLQTKESDKKETIEGKNDRIELIIRQEESEDPLTYPVSTSGAKIGRHTSNSINIA